jgi:hypothetical protein
MKIVGVLVIINALILCASWMIGQNPSNKLGVVTVTLIAVFTGVFLLLFDRITEVSVQGVGTMKAAAASAKADAQEIADIKKRVENQSATIDMVASKASQAEALTQQVQRMLDFSVTIQKALADDRAAFESLARYVDEHSELSPIAANVYIGVRLDAAGPIGAGFLNLPPDHPLRTATKLEDIRTLYSQLSPLYRPHGITLVVNNPNIDVKDKLRLCLDILTQDPSLNATNIAGKFAASQTNSQWEPFKVQPAIEKIKEKLETK